MLPSDSVASETSEPVQLSVETGDAAAEVYAIDADLRLVDRQYGASVDFTLPAGTYKIKVQTGQATQERLVDLTDTTDSRAVEVFEPQDFASPIPLLNSSTASASQCNAAHNHSKRFRETLGSGASVFFFIRSPRLFTSYRRVVEPTALTRGLSLRDAAGDLLADFSRKADFSGPNEEAWAVYSAKLDPGTYRLRLTTDRAVLEQSIIACPGWQCQWFALPTNPSAAPNTGPTVPGDSSEIWPDLSSASLSYSKESLVTFEPDSEAARLTDLTRQALLRNRLTLSDEIVDSMLYGKFENPMLGIFAGHLLLSGKLDGTRFATATPQERANTVQEVVRNLRNLLGRSHPDVEALALGAGLSDVAPVASPPMLRRSWTLLLNGTATRPGLIPSYSLAGRIPTHLWSVEPWLVWSPPQAEDEAPDTLRTFAMTSETSDASVPESDTMRSAVLGYSSTLDDATLNRLLWLVVHASAPEDSASPESASLRRLRKYSPDDSLAQLPPLSDAQYAELVRLSGIPRATLEDWLRRRTP